MTVVTTKIKSLGALEKFSLVTGSIGLIVDSIALIALVVQVVNSANQEQKIKNPSQNL